MDILHICLDDLLLGMNGKVYRHYIALEVGTQRVCLLLPKGILKRLPSLHPNIVHACVLSKRISDEYLGEHIIN